MRRRRPVRGATLRIARVHQRAPVGREGLVGAPRIRMHQARSQQLFVLFRRHMLRVRQAVQGVVAEALAGLAHIGPLLLAHRAWIVGVLVEQGFRTRQQFVRQAVRDAQRLVRVHAVPLRVRDALAAIETDELKLADNRLGMRRWRRVRKERRERHELAMRAGTPIKLRREGAVPRRLRHDRAVRVAWDACIRIHAVVRHLAPLGTLHVKEDQGAYGAERDDGDDRLPSQRDPAHDPQACKGNPCAYMPRSAAAAAALGRARERLRYGRGQGAVMPSNLVVVVVGRYRRVRLEVEAL